MDPRPFTLRQLTWMSNAKGNFDWQQTSALESLQINMNRKKGSKTVSPDELNPYADHSRKDSTVITGKNAWSILKSVVTSKSLNTDN